MPILTLIPYKLQKVGPTIRLTEKIVKLQAHKVLNILRSMNIKYSGMKLQNFSLNQ